MSSTFSYSSSVEISIVLMGDNSIIYWGEFNMKVTGPQAPPADVDITTQPHKALI